VPLGESVIGGLSTAPLLESEKIVGDDNKVKPDATVPPEAVNDLDEAARLRVTPAR